MAKSSKIKVMISSRCEDKFPLSSGTGKKLSDFRRRLKGEVEAATLFGERPYEIWIHEKATEDVELDAWDECLRQARECDIFIALYNGNAGWLGAWAEQWEFARKSLSRPILRHLEKFSS
jgi:Domain of unknown function (DUF4062)